MRCNIIGSIVIITLALLCAPLATDAQAPVQTEIEKLRAEIRSKDQEQKQREKLDGEYKKRLDEAKMHQRNMSTAAAKIHYDDQIRDKAKGDPADFDQVVSGAIEEAVLEVALRGGDVLLELARRDLGHLVDPGVDEVADRSLVEGLVLGVADVERDGGLQLRVRNDVTPPLRTCGYRNDGPCRATRPLVRSDSRSQMDGGPRSASWCE